MDRFLNAIKASAAAMDRTSAQPRFAVVTSVDPTRPAVRVALQPEGVITGWLPVLSPWIGAGWGMSCPPSPGDQVFVLAQEGDSEHGVVIGRAWSDTARTPQAAPGELWLVHQSGAFIKLASDGTIRTQGDLHHTGNLFVTGDIQSNQNIRATQNVEAGQNIAAIVSIRDKSGTLDRLRQHYNGHTHFDPQGGSVSQTNAPD
jgi:phage baseplate assembly protein V